MLGCLGNTTKARVLKRKSTMGFHRNRGHFGWSSWTVNFMNVFFCQNNYVMISPPTIHDYIQRHLMMFFKSAMVLRDGMTCLNGMNSADEAKNEPSTIYWDLVMSSR